MPAFDPSKLTSLLAAVDASLSELKAYAASLPPVDAGSGTVIDTPPASGKVTMRADDEASLATAIANGANRIETMGLVLTKAFDLKGATIVRLAGPEWWKAAVELKATGGIANGRIDTDGAKAIVVSGGHTTIANVTVGAGVNYVLHVTGGEVSVRGLRTDATFKGYGVYQEPGTFVAMVDSFIGSSSNESSYRSTGGRAELEDVEIDALNLPAPAKRTALRGDFPATSDGKPGLHVSRCTFKGLVGPNPLDDDTAGRYAGITSWRTPKGATLTSSIPATVLLKVAQGAYKDGQSLAEIVRGVSLAAGLKLTAEEVAATVAFRKAEIGRTSNVLIEDSTILGQIRLAARTVGKVVRCKVDAGTASVFAGNSATTYPGDPFVLDKSEIGKPPAWLFESCELKGGKLDVAAKDYPGVTLDGKALA